MLYGLTYENTRVSHLVFRISGKLEWPAHTVDTPFPETHLPMEIHCPT